MARRVIQQKVDIQESFLSSLKKKFDNELGADVCLWQLSYSYMRLTICYTEKQKINEKKLIETLYQEMESENFKKLIDLGFKKEFKKAHINIENEIRYVWEKKRDKLHPHGNVHIFCSGGVDFGRDDAGSIWCRFGFGDWELHSWKE